MRRSTQSSLTRRRWPRSPEPIMARRGVVPRGPSATLLVLSNREIHQTDTSALAAATQGFGFDGLRLAAPRSVSWCLRGAPWHTRGTRRRAYVAAVRLVGHLCHRVSIWSRAARGFAARSLMGLGVGFSSGPLSKPAMPLVVFESPTEMSAAARLSDRQRHHERSAPPIVRLDAPFASVRCARRRTWRDTFRPGPE